MFWLLAPFLRHLLDPRGLALLAPLVALQLFGVDVLGAAMNTVVNPLLSWLQTQATDSLTFW